jgi:hypothetical protein
MREKARAERVQPSRQEPIEIQLISDGFEARDISADGRGHFVPPISRAARSRARSTC